MFWPVSRGVAGWAQEQTVLLLGPIQNQTQPERTGGTEGASAHLAGRPDALAHAVPCAWNALIQFPPKSKSSLPKSPG